MNCAFFFEPGAGSVHPPEYARKFIAGFSSLAVLPKPEAGASNIHPEDYRTGIAKNSDIDLSAQITQRGPDEGTTLQESKHVKYETGSGPRRNSRTVQ